MWSGLHSPLRAAYLPIIQSIISNLYILSHLPNHQRLRYTLEPLLVPTLSRTPISSTSLSSCHTPNSVPGAPPGTMEFPVEVMKRVSTRIPSSRQKQPEHTALLIMRTSTTSSRSNVMNSQQAEERKLHHRVIIDLKHIRAWMILTATLGHRRYNLGGNVVNITVNFLQPSCRLEKTDDSRHRSLRSTLTATWLRHGAAALHPPPPPSSSSALWTVDLLWSRVLSWHPTDAQLREAGWHSLSAKHAP